jgi:hypothetical protein
MAEVRREDKQLKKDQSGSREAREEMNEEVRSSGTKPRMENPNRDRARGDWDRTNQHQDKNASRAEEEDEEKER